MTPSFAYVGSRTSRERHARGEGITVWRVRPSGGLEHVHTAGGLVNPSYLALNQRGDRLYAVHGDGESVSVLAADPADGRLELLQTRSCGGLNPVHLALADGERHLLVANHLGGGVAVLPIEPDGRLGDVAARVVPTGSPGPHRVEQPGPKPHCVQVDRSGQWVVVADKGLDRLFSFRLAGGRLSPASTPHVQARQGAGPRHVAFHPSGRWVHAVNELDSTITAYRFDLHTGALTPFQWLPCLPDDYTGDSRAAAVVVDATGTFLYASNRGHDSIAVFAIDGETGRLRFEGCTSSEGRTPRFITLDPTGRWLHVLNEDSDGIVSFEVDRVSGALTASGPPLACGSPVCMVFSRGA